MLNPFPLQFLSLFAYFILRIIIGFVFLVLGYRHFKQRESLYSALTLSFFPYGKMTTILFILTELTIGTLFVLGLYTQIAAILTILMSAKMLFIRQRFVHDALPSRLVYLLFFGIGWSLFITGAGVFAFDLPI